MVPSYKTYIKFEVKGKWKYLYRAVDSDGNTLRFVLSAKCDVRAAECFFPKAINASHNQEPRVINVDKNPAYLRHLMNSKQIKLSPKLPNYDQ